MTHWLKLKSLVIPGYALLMQVQIGLTTLENSLPPYRKVGKTNKILSRGKYIQGKRQIKKQTKKTTTRE